MNSLLPFTKEFGPTWTALTPASRSTSSATSVSTRESMFIHTLSGGASRLIGFGMRAPTWNPGLSSAEVVTDACPLTNSSMPMSFRLIVFLNSMSLKSGSVDFGHDMSESRPTASSNDAGVIAVVTSSAASFTAETPLDTAFPTAFAAPLTALTKDLQQKPLPGCVGSPSLLENDGSSFSE